jgi:hypothetical protein
MLGRFSRYKRMRLYRHRTGGMMDKEAIQILENLVKKLDGLMKQAQRDAEHKRIAAESIMICRDEVDFAVDKIKNLATAST